MMTTLKGAEQRTWVRRTLVDRQYNIVVVTAEVTLCFSRNDAALTCKN